MSNFTHFNIHADNIVECERMLHLIESAFEDIGYSIKDPFGSPVCPSFLFQIQGKSKPLQFTFYPGYGRWHADILQLVKNRGGRLREAADVILTGITSKEEIPLIAIEYCGALPAGNQAWQRNGRAYSYGLARIPYLYIAEIGGYELCSDRKRKAPRLPNPAVPFSYLSFSISHDTSVIPVFTTSPGAGEESKRQYNSILGDTELSCLIRAIILADETQLFFDSLKEKVLTFVTLRASLSRQNRTLTPEQWKNAYNSIHAGSSLLSYLLSEARLSWSKTAYIKGLTHTAQKLMAISSRFAIGLTSTDLPICIIPEEYRQAFAKKVNALYPKLSREFFCWVSAKEHLVICWVMGFKPRGDDARPDRGLPPLARMLVGDKAQLLTVVYGPATRTTWPLLKSEPGTLAKQNGLWEAILEVSDAILVDSITDKVTGHGFLRQHWQDDSPQTFEKSIIVPSFPRLIGENDIDTVLHTMFARLSQPYVFEGMCNPPGGDWSGLSLLSLERTLELRWLSLPRVSGRHTKRPDHVFQIFGVADAPIILVLESKEHEHAVERGIGPRLKAYISGLLSTPASIQRSISNKDWTHSPTNIDVKDFLLCSGVAFLMNSTTNIKTIGRMANVDVVFAFYFEVGGQSCRIKILPFTTTGKIIAKFILTLNISKSLPITFSS